MEFPELPLLGGCQCGLRNMYLATFGKKTSNFFIVCRRFNSERMFRGDRQIGDTHDRIGSRCKHRQRLVLAIDFELEFQPLGSADPVLLHRPY